MSLCFQGTETKTYVGPYFSLPSTECTIYTWHRCQKPPHRGSFVTTVQNGGEKPIAYSSRTLTKWTRNFFVTRRKILAAVEFVKRHCHYLCDRKCFLRIDHSPIPSVLRTKEPKNQRASVLDGSNSLLLSTSSLNVEPEIVTLMQIPCPDTRAQKDLNGLQTSISFPSSDNLNDDVHGENSPIKNRNPLQIFRTSGPRDM